MRIAAIAAAALVTACAADPGRDLGRGAGAPPPEASAEELAAATASSAARCEHGFAVDCRKLGRAHLSGAGVPADDRLAAAYLMKGCEIGEPASCSDLGVLTILGRGVAQDDAAGAALSRRACEAGYALACSNLGTLSVEGVGKQARRPGPEARDGARIVGQFETACEAGALEGCLNLGTALERGLLVDRDLPGAGRAFQRACQGGLPIACHRWALLAARSPEAAPGADAAALGAVACRAGITQACAQPGVSPGPSGPLTPTPRLAAEPSSYALGIPGAGGFHPTDLSQPPGALRRSRGRFRPLSPDLLAALPAPLRARLGLEAQAGGDARPDEPIELLLRLRRGQLATCLERERSSPGAAELAATFVVESNGRPDRLRVASEPADPGLEACASEVIGGWSFPVPVNGSSGTYLVRFAFEAAPAGPAPEYASASVLRPALKEAGCVERHLRVPDAYGGAENSITVKLVVDRGGRPALFHALTPAPEPLVAAVGEAVRACAFTPGVGEDGQPMSVWLTLTVRLDSR